MQSQARVVAADYIAPAPPDSPLPHRSAELAGAADLDLGNDPTLKAIAARIAKCHVLLASGPSRKQAMALHGLLVGFGAEWDERVQQILETHREIEDRCMNVAVIVRDDLAETFGATEDEAAPLAEAAIRRYREDRGEQAAVPPIIQRAIRGHDERRQADHTKHVTPPLRQHGQHVRRRHGGKTLRSPGSSRGSTGDSSEPEPEPPGRRRDGAAQQALVGASTDASQAVVS
jgi:hypothetical protein